MRCEEACSRLPFPSSFALWNSRKCEDRLIIDSSKPGCALWAVFDGHRGKDISVHAAKTFPSCLWHSCEKSMNPGQALYMAMQMCHETARHEALKGGSTALAVLAVGGAIWCASAGDSRVVAGLRNGSCVRLSVDHVVSRPEEVQRIEAMGACLEFGRCGGILPMTRGLGNFDLEADGFTYVPHVEAAPLSEVEFVVLASDGLWDVMEDEAACELVRQLGAQGAGSGSSGPETCISPSAADNLAFQARRLGSTDDIAVIVAHMPAHLLAATPCVPHSSTDPIRSLGAVFAAGA